MREKTLTLLGTLFSLGVLADITLLFINNAFDLAEEHLLTRLLYFITFFVIVLLFGISLLRFWGKARNLKQTERGEAVDALIEDGKGNVVVIERMFPPYQGMYALPGGFIERERGEKPKDAVIREVREETNLEIEIERKVGEYDKKGRDPRDDIKSTVFKCRCEDFSKLNKGEDTQRVKLISLRELKTKEIAFDHRQMLKDAGYDV
ncbi:MAG: NUDIX hydrolase [Candidatus Lokiarchaeota archaeon]|nr:NUDIX hydrolase [Candidatus Lokiarchaeota archaeon]